MIFGTGLCYNADLQQPEGELAEANHVWKYYYSYERRNSLFH